jgi:creatinine amidohydrolase
MTRLVSGATVLVLALLAHGLVPASARGARPDTVFFEDLTFDEIRDAIAGGTTNVIIAAGGLEANGPQLVAGTSTDIVTYTSDRIARAVGGTLVAPVIAFAPGGTLPVPSEKGYAGLLEAAATSVKGSGFRNIFFVGEPEASQGPLKAVAETLDAAWKNEGVRVHYVSDYSSQAGLEQKKYVADKLRVRPVDPAQRDAFVRTSEVLAINGRRARLGKLESEIEAAPAPQYGLALLAIKVDAAAAQIRTLLGRSAQASAPAANVTGPRVLPTPNPFVASGPSRFLEDLTSAEIREAIAGGSTVLIVPTGGTEKNGFHMAMGKHNFHTRAGAEVMAAKLGNALVAPVLQYVPEGQASIATPGVLSCARECFEQVVGSIAGGAKSLGFTDVLLVGDNGGNQAPLSNVAAALNKEWEGTGVKAYALTDFYDKGHEYQDAWFLGQFGWDASVVGSHAGIKDTSQLLYVKPEDVRTDRIADSFTNTRESGISGDPTKATAEFGRIAIAFKANAAIAQYRALKGPARAESGDGGRPARRGNR